MNEVKRDDNVENDNEKREPGQEAMQRSSEN